MDHNLLNECEREQLHLSGKIQSYGALLVVNQDYVISHLSDNVASIFSSSVSLSVGERLADFIYHRLIALNLPANHSQVFYCLDDQSQEYEVIATRYLENCYLEVTPVAEQHNHLNLQPLALPSAINDDISLAQLQSQLVNWIGQQLGHERVMYYQFLENGDGHVRHEYVANENLGSYLGLRFPASDIPQVARAIYLQNRWREIVDTSASAVDVIGQDDSLDLTLVDLRSVSPVHVQYMSNMGIKSSLSFSVVINGQLDALITSHSSYPVKVSYQQLEHIANTIADYALLVGAYRSRERLRAIDQFESSLLPLQRELVQATDLPTLWHDLAGFLMDRFEAEGVILCTGDSYLSEGACFDEMSLAQVDQWFCEQEDLLVFSTDSVFNDIDQSVLSTVVGVAALKFRTEQSKTSVRLYLCREDSQEEVDWGGKPNKPQINDDAQVKISPRTSFAKWVEKRLGYSQPWPAVTQLQLHKLRNLLQANSGLYEG